MTVRMGQRHLLRVGLLQRRPQPPTIPMTMMLLPPLMTRRGVVKMKNPDP